MENERRAARAGANPDANRTATIAIEPLDRSPDDWPADDGAADYWPANDRSANDRIAHYGPTDDRAADPGTADMRRDRSGGRPAAARIGTRVVLSQG